MTWAADGCAVLVRVLVVMAHRSLPGVSLQGRAGKKRRGCPQGRVKVGNVRSGLRRWSTLAPVRRLSLPYGSLPARSAPAFRPGQSDLAVRCAGQHGHVDSSPQLVLGGIYAAQMPARRL